MPKQTTTTPRKPRSRKRLAAAAALALTTLAAATAAVLLYTPLVGNIVLNEISTKLNANATADSVRLKPNGTLVATNFNLTLKGIEGDAAKLISAKNAVIDIDFSRLLSPQLPARRVTATGVEIRLSIDEDLNPNTRLLALPEPTGYFPEVVLNNTTLTIAEHNDNDSANSRNLQTINLNAELIRDPDNPATLNATITETGPLTDDAGRIRAAGTFNAADQSADLTLRGIDFDTWSHDNAPTAIRRVIEQLELAGNVNTLRFSTSASDGPRLAAVFDNVALTIPIDPASGAVVLGEPVEGLDTTPLRPRMSNVNGELAFTPDAVNADITGTIEELTATIDLDYNGYDQSAPFNATLTINDLTLGPEPDVIAVAPPLAREIYQRFGQPTGSLTGTVTVRRTANAGPTRYEGEINVADATMAFEDFPYPLTNVTGTIRFNNDRLDIIDFTGTGSDNATAAASGHIIPPGDGAEVRVDVSVRNAPADDALERSLPDGTDEVYRLLLHQPALDNLYARGLAQPPARRTELLNDAAAIERQIATLRGQDAEPERIRSLERDRAELLEAAETPTFDLTNTADVDISVRRAAGPDSNYETYADITINNAQALPEPFPYPVLADTITIDVDPLIARFNATNLRGINGGSGSLTGTVTFDRTGSNIDPVIDINVSNAPIDPFLLHALPNDDRAKDPGPDDTTVESILTAFNPTGTINADARITSAGPNTNNVAINVNVALNNITLTAPGDDDPPEITNASGTININRSRVTTDNISAQLAGAPLTATATFDIADNPDSPTGLDRIDVTLAAQAIDLAAPIERFARPFAPDAEQTLADLRARFQPDGRADGTLTLTGDPLNPSYDATVTRAQSLAIDLFEGRAELLLPTGTIHATNTATTLNTLSGDARFNGEPAGRITLDGQLAAAETPDEPHRLNVTVTDATAQSPATRAVLRLFAPGAYTFANDTNLQATYNATTTLITLDDGTITAPSTNVEPKSLSLDFGKGPLTFTIITGTAQVTATGGTVNLAATSPELSGSFKGDWFPAPEGWTLSLDGDLSASAPALPAQLRDALPPAVADPLIVIELTSEGPVSLKNASLALARPHPTEPNTNVTMFTGELFTTDAALLAGVQFTNIDGHASIDIGPPRNPESPDRDRPWWNVAVRADNATLEENFPLTDLRALVHAGNELGSAIIPTFTAELFSGRIAAEASVLPGDPNAINAPLADPMPTIFNVRTVIDDVSVGELIDASAPTQNPDASAATPSNARGKLTAELALDGYTARPETRRGILRARVVPARNAQATELLRAPGVVTLTRLTNLQAPLPAPITNAYADAYIQGDTIRVREISLESAAGDVAIVGAGNIAWPSLELDMRFTTEYLGLATIFRDIADRIRNEVAAARVTGTLAEPVIEIDTLRGTRNVIDSIFRARDSKRPRTVKPGQDL